MVSPERAEVDLVFPAARPITGPVAVSTVAVFTGPGRLMGYSVNGGAAQGAFTIYDGSNTTGQLVVSETVAANGSPVVWFGPGGIELRQGAAVDVTAALGALVLYIAPGWRPGVRY